MRAAAPLYRSGWSVGGAEYQSVYLARALADAGLRTRHIVEATPGEPAPKARGDVEIVTFERPASSPVARYRAILGALAEADARAYIQLCASYETGLVGLWARSHRRAFVFASMSDADFVTDRTTARASGAGLHLRRVVAQYRIGVRLASTIVVQTEAQAELARRFGVRAPVVLPSFGLAAAPHPGPRRAFLWIGRLIERKDPLAYLELARRVPEAHFWMLPNEQPDGPAIAERLRQEAGSIPNLELLAGRSNAEVLDLMRSAVAIVNTSSLEGLPNTFLEAWAQGTPALSLRLDYDGLIEANGLGLAAGGSMDRLAQEARDRWNSREDAFSEAALAYMRRVHDPEVVGGQWAELVRRLLDA
jgi:glycosyltransferase involved in cell wall biosynthesis